MILPIIGAVSLIVTAARASTVLNPLPEPSTTLFGYAVSAMGDVNGDGVADYAVGTPYQDGDFVSTAMGFGTPQNVGKVFVIDGATLTVLFEMNDPEFEVIQPQHFGGQLGDSLAVSADINGDGVSDVIAGVPQHIENPDQQDNIINLAGKALVFSGKDGTLLFTLKDPTAEEDGKFGTAVAALGDVDGDGVPDFVVGTPGKDLDAANVGIAYVFSGKTGQVIKTLNDPPRGGDEAGAAFGSAIANAGDVDGDRVSEIAIGAPGEGRVYVFSGKTGSLLYSIVSPVADDDPSFGAALSGGQDFNKDKKPDIVVGAPLSNSSRGAVYVYNGADGMLIRTLKAPVSQTYAKFGAAVYAAPDLTGDKRADIVVGAPGQGVNGLDGAGQAYIFDGTRGRLNKTLSSANPQADAGYGSALTSTLFAGTRVSTPIVGVPYEDAKLTNDTGTVVHLEIGQIEIAQ